MRRAIIVGGGIGGLFAAICLRMAGWDVRVLEQSDVLGEVGAGIQISPNGVHLLKKADVFSHLESDMFVPEAIEMRLNRTGRRFCYLPLAKAATKRWGAPYISVHRADLIAALGSRLSALQPDALILNAKLSSYGQEGDSVQAILADGRVFDADLLVAADGVHSVVRHQMFGHISGPKKDGPEKDGPERADYTGNVAYRAVVPADRLGALQPPPTACIWTGAAKHAVTTRIRGGKMVNFVGIVEQDTAPNDAAESWSQKASKSEALAHFKDSHPILQNILEQAEQINCWPLFARAPLPHWSERRVVLLGDAAHPMLPALAQGGVQALEDGAVLADCLSSEASIPAALGAYFQCRIARTSKIQAQSAANLRLYHHAGLPAQIAAYLPIWLASTIAPKLIYRRLDWLMRG